MSSRSTSGLIAGLLTLFLAVPAAAQTCGAGDAVFTELMVSPLNTSLEWIELRILADGGCSLDDCALYDETDDEPLPADIADWLASEAVLAGSWAQGDYVLLAKNREEVSAGLAAVSYDSSLYLSADEELHLLCGGVIVDSIDWDWGVFDDRCSQPLADEQHGCSVNLPEELEGASTPGTDDFADWCLPPESTLWTDVHATTPKLFSGTPGAPGVCATWDWPETATITEYMVAATSGELPDWFEIEAQAGTDLRGCAIERWAATGGVDGYEIDGDAYAQQNWIGWEGGETVVPVEGVMVLTHKDCLDGSAVPQGQHGCAATATLPPSHAYPTVSFVASSPQWLGLYCPGDGPDRELLDGTFMDQSWPGGENGRSWCYDPALSSDPEHNDQPDPWLPTLDATPYTEDPGTGEPNFGTPGEVGSCLPEGPPVPVRGELLITEVMVAPAGLPEWIEVANLSAEARSLGGCTLNHVKVDEDGDPASDVSQFLLGSGGGIPVLEPGGRWVLTEDDCLDGADPEVGDCALDNESWYAGIGLSNDARHLIWIECPGSEDAVDEVVAAPDLADPPYGVRNAHSMAFVPDSVDCGGLDPEDCNDAPELWCEAGFDHPYPVGSTDPENYGTPGEVGGCSLGGEGNGEGGGDDDDTCLSPGGCADPECGCDCNGAVGGRPPNAAIAWLMGVALLLLRRRRADPGD